MRRIPRSFQCPGTPPAPHSHSQWLSALTCYLHLHSKVSPGEYSEQAHDKLIPSALVFSSIILTVESWQHYNSDSTLCLKGKLRFFRMQLACKWIGQSLYEDFSSFYDMKIVKCRFSMWLLLKKNHQKGQRFGDKGKQSILFHGNNFNQNQNRQNSHLEMISSLWEKLTLLLLFKPLGNKLMGWLVKIYSFFLMYLFLFIWLHWVLVAARRIFIALFRIFHCGTWSLVAARGSAVAVMHRLSCSMACGI